jgi:hypothetical protein
MTQARFKNPLAHFRKADFSVPEKLVPWAEKISFTALPVP